MAPATATARRPIPEGEFQRLELVGTASVFDDERDAKSALVRWNLQGFGFETRMYKRSVRGGGVKATVFVLVTRVVRK